MEDLLRALEEVADAINRIEGGQTDVTIKDMVVLGGPIGNLKNVIPHATKQVAAAMEKRATDGN